MAVDVVKPAAKASIAWQQGDRLAVRVSGRVALDVVDEGDRALFGSLELGSDVTLLVNGVVVQEAANANLGPQGDFDGYTASKTINLHSIQPA